MGVNVVEFGGHGFIVVDIQVVLEGRDIELASGNTHFLRQFFGGFKNLGWYRYGCFHISKVGLWYNFVKTLLVQYRVTKLKEDFGLFFEIIGKTKV
jgi:hypothetical protein